MVMYDHCEPVSLWSVFYGFSGLTHQQISKTNANCGGRHHPSARCIEFHGINMNIALIVVFQPFSRYLYEYHRMPELHNHHDTAYSNLR
jgi:hypothetical protein